MTGREVYRRGDVLWRRTYDRVVILLPGSREFLTLRASGCDLWSVLAEPGSLPEIANRLAESYSAPAEKIAVDIAPVIRELSQCGAVAVSTYP